MPRALYSCLVSLAVITSLSGCTGILFNVADPGGSTPTNDIIKSLRCELVSYLSINYQYALSFDELAKQRRIAEAIQNYPYLDIDRWQYAGIGVDLKDINTISAGFGISRKSLSDAPRESPNFGNTRSFNLGPSLGLASTYSRSQVYAIPQYAGIGPALPGKDSTTQIYAPQYNADESFFCYKPLPLPEINTREERLKDLQNLIDNNLPQYARFRRVMVGGQIPLARWLQEIGVDMAQNRLSSVPTTENLFPGQLSYTFGLQIKPAINAGYTLIATEINPFTPSGTASIDTTSTFSIFLNAKNSKLAFGSRAGAAELDAATKAAIPQTP